MPLEVLPESHRSCIGVARPKTTRLPSGKKGSDLSVFAFAPAEHGSSGVRAEPSGLTV